MTTVVLTRPSHRLKVAKSVYTESGLNTLSMPCFAIQSNTEVSPEELSLAERTPLLLILNSNAIKHVLLMKPDFTLSNQTQVMGVGTGVAAYWQQHFDQPILTPSSQDSAGLIALLEHQKPSELVILTAEGGLDLVRRYCIEKQIQYRQINSYQRLPMALEFASLSALLKADEPVVITITSGLILNHFCRQCPKELMPKVLNQPVVCGAQRIAYLAAELGFTEIIEADSPSNEDMKKAVLEVCSD